MTTEQKVVQLIDGGWELEHGNTWNRPDKSGAVTGTDRAWEVMKEGEVGPSKVEIPKEDGRVKELLAAGWEPNVGLNGEAWQSPFGYRVTDIGVAWNIHSEKTRKYRDLVIAGWKETGGSWWPPSRERMYMRLEEAWEALNGSVREMSPVELEIHWKEGVLKGEGWRVEGWRSGGFGLWFSPEGAFVGDLEKAWNYPKVNRCLDEVAKGMGGLAGVAPGKVGGHHPSKHLDVLTKAAGDGAMVSVELREAVGWALGRLKILAQVEALLEEGRE